MPGHRTGVPVHYRWPCGSVSSQAKISDSGNGKSSRLGIKMNRIPSQCPIIIYLDMGVDVVVFGATGEVGRVVCSYLFSRGKLAGVTSWAPAGRNLEKIAATLGEESNTPVQHPRPNPSPL